LQNQADDPGELAADGEEGQPWQDKSNDEAHSFSSFSAPVYARRRSG
jgi:hypothetical protein